MLWIEQLKFNEMGLIRAIAQDYQDNTVLMMAWMNRKSIQRTLETGEIHYWSRCCRVLGLILNKRIYLL